MKLSTSYLLPFILQITGSAAQGPGTEVLNTFCNAFFNGIFISPNETLFQETYNMYTRDLVETGNGESFTFDTFKPWLEEQRAAFVNREIVSSDITIVPNATDSTGRTGSVGHKIIVSATLTGTPVLATVVTVVRVVLNERGNQAIDEEDFVLAVSE